MSEEIITETNRETATDHEYGGAQIQVLEGLEAVRKRPGMYIGSTGPSGLHHLVYEIVDNSIDEALAGYCTHIEVTIKPGNIIEVSDNGRGIPVDIQPKLGIPAVTVVYTVLHAGGKFGGEDSGYKVAGGLHGVGASVVNALSEWLVVHVRRDGAEYEQSFKRGKPDGDLKKIGVAASTGTTVTFKPDPEMFTETTEYDYEILLKRLREESFLNAGVRITLTDERPESIEKNDGVPPQESMCYEGGVRSFVQYLHEKRDLTPLHPQVIYMKGEANGAVAEVALQYCDSYNELILSFANNVHTPEGGTHEEGLKTALTRVFNEFGRAKGYLKEKDENWQGSDVREGMIAVVSVKLQEAQFEGQTKAKLGNTYIKTLVSNIVYNKLSEFLEENPAVAKAVFEKVTQAARARAAAKKARDLNVPGRDANGVHFAVDYLTSVTRSLLDSQFADGKAIDAKGKNVLVIGGGDTGNDCQGTALRQGCADLVALEMMPQPPKERAASNPWPEWPRVLKVDYGQTECLAKFGKDPRVYQTTVKEFLKDDAGNLTGAIISYLKPERNPETGRTSMVPTGEEFTYNCQLAFIAAGFTGCESYVADAFGVELTARGNVADHSFKTNVEKVFVCGDMRRGQSLVVWGLREGRDCAAEVDRYLMGYTNL